MTKGQQKRGPGARTEYLGPGGEAGPKSKGMSLLEDETWVGRVERLRWQLGRAETWVANADAKATVLLGMSGAIIAAVLTVEPSVVTEFLSKGLLAQGLSGLLVGTVSYSAIEAALAVLPNLGKPKSGGSIFHFWDVAGMTLDGFSAISGEMTPLLETQGLEHQVFAVSRIASAKFRRLRRSAWSLVGTVFAGVAILVVHHLQS